MAKHAGPQRERATTARGRSTATTTPNTVHTVFGALSKRRAEPWAIMGEYRSKANAERELTKWAGAKNGCHYWIDSDAA